MTGKYFMKSGPVLLEDADFVASGGEGSVYVKWNTAYKIYHDVNRALFQHDIDLLSKINLPTVIRPLELIHNYSGLAVGHSMSSVSNTVPLCSLFPKAYKARHKLNPNRITNICANLYDIVKATHDAGVLIVDLNEMNFLVSTDDHKTVYAIDVDSYQTPNRPSTSLMESVRDWSAGTKFTKDSDWFSFAVIVFQLFTGIHPYKGKHPKVKTLKERMEKNLSVFDADVTVPASTDPYTIIPVKLLEWLRSVLQKGKRLPPPPPKDWVDIPAMSAPSGMFKHPIAVKIQQQKTKLYKSDSGVVITSVFDAPCEIKSYFCMKDSWGIQCTDGRLFANGIFVGSSSEPVASMWVGNDNHYWIATLNTGSVTVRNLQTGAHLTPSMEAFGVSCEGNPHTRVFRTVYAHGYSVFSTDTKVPIGHVSHNAIFYPGCIIDSMGSIKIVNIIRSGMPMAQVNLPDIIDFHVLAAHAKEQTIVVRGIDSHHQRSLKIAFLNEQYKLSSAIVSIPSGVQDIPFVALSSNMVAYQVESGEVRVTNEHGTVTVKSPQFDMGMNLVALPTAVGKLGFWSGKNLYSMKRA